jgi:hypothetical protein
MSLPREPFAWDGDHDLPVPLDDSNPDLPVTSQILSEAETVVRHAQADMARQDTDPTITIPALVSESRRINLRIGWPLSRRSLEVTLTFACALAFLHGWSVGASAAENPPAKSCDAHHCQDDPSK